MTVMINPSIRSHKGILVSIEGVDGSGKSTLAAHMYQKLMGQHIPTYLTHEPGDTILGQRIRHLLNDMPEKPNGLSEFLLFSADRAEHFSKIIIPELQQGKVVISDRLSDSSLAYQGYGRGVNLDTIKIINDKAMQGIKPDLVLYIDIDRDTALNRIKKSRGILSNFELEAKAFWERVHSGFEEIFANRDDVIKLNGHNPTQDQSAAALTEVIAKWKHYAQP